MKKSGLSLAVLAALSTSAFADIKLTEFGGSASLFYGTNDDAGAGDLFDRTSSYGDSAVNLNGSATVGSCGCTTINFGVTGVSTLGLEHTLVAGTWVDHDGGLNDAIWIDTLNMVANPLDGISNTTLIIGRQALATPMVFTETWNIAKNTFDAVVAVNTDIKDTTMVGAWVGRSNGINALYANPTTPMSGTVHAANFGDGYSSFLTSEGAYAFGAVTKLIPTVDTQLWYYIAPSVAKVAWLQAETEIAGVTLGGQYAMLDADDNSDGNAFAVKVGYAVGDLGLSAAYSSVDDMAGTSAALGFVNLDGAQTPLYTAGWWNVGGQGASNTDAYNITATYAMKNVADLGLYVTSWETGSDSVLETAVTAGKSIGSLDVTLAYIYTDDDTVADSQNDIQAYFTYNF